ncbi:dihydrodipicolinate reductase [Streptomyces sp. UC1A3]
MDQDTRVAGQDLGVLLGGAANGLVIVSDPADVPAADLAIVATISDLHRVADTLLPLLERSYNVLSISEELAYPWQSHPGLARRLDDTAKAHGVTVLGSGAKPGLLMDTLPLLLTALTQRVESVYPPADEHVTLRRDPVEVRPRSDHRGVRDGSQPGRGRRALRLRAGHRGARGRARGDLDSVDVAEVEPAVVTTSPRVGDHLRIEPGQITAVTHAARGMLKGEPVIDLEITFGFLEPTGEVAAGDGYRIVGEEQVIDLRSSVGFDSFLSTIATAVNAAAAVVEARPGLLSMGDLPARSVAAEGEQRAARASLGPRLLRTETETRKTENLPPTRLHTSRRRDARRGSSAGPERRLAAHAEHILTRTAK